LLLVQAGGKLEFPAVDWGRLWQMHMTGMSSQQLQAVQDSMEASVSADVTSARANLRLPRLGPTFSDDAAGVVPPASAGEQVLPTTQYLQAEAEKPGQCVSSALSGLADICAASSSAPCQHPRALPDLAQVHALPASSQVTASSGVAAPEMQMSPATPATTPAMVGPASVDLSAQQLTPEGAAGDTAAPAAIADDLFREQVQLFDVLYHNETWQVEDDLSSILDMADVQGYEARTAALQQGLARTLAGRQANAVAALVAINAAESNRVLHSYLSDPSELEMQQLLLAAAAANDQQEQQYMADMVLALGL
jgi:hypothetical protein